MTPGWPRRYRETLKEYLEWIGAQDAEEGKKYLTSHPGIGEKTAERLLRERPALADSLIKKPDELIVKGRIRDEALRILLEQQEDGEFKKRLLEKAALADEPVTTDTKR